MGNKTSLSAGAELVLADVLDAMQQADEMGGTADEADYIALMNRLILEATTRRDTCEANLIAGIQVSVVDQDGAGEDSSLADFLSAKADGFAPDERAALLTAMVNGEAYSFGGGAAPAFTLTRVL